MKRDDSSRRSKTENATEATAIGSTGTSGLSFTGVLMTLPLWLATLAFVLELFAPVPVFVVLKRRIGEG